ADRKRVLHADEEPQLARPPHHRLPDEAVYEFPPNRDADCCRGQSRVQRRDRLSHRTGSAAAVTKESAAGPPPSRSGGRGLVQRGSAFVEERPRPAAGG